VRSGIRTRDGSVGDRWQSRERGGRRDAAVGASSVSGLSSTVTAAARVRGGGCRGEWPTPRDRGGGGVSWSGGAAGGDGGAALEVVGGDGCVRGMKTMKGSRVRLTQ
jgi:hypothetical protein